MTLPPVPPSFSWSEAPPCGVVLRCRPLDALADHLFTTRELSLRSESDWDRLRDALGARRVVTLAQVHGRDVVVVRRGQAAGAQSAGDVLVSDDPDVAIAVRAADCVPMLIADASRGVVAAVHAGWRGTAAGAAAAAVEALRREFGTRPGDLVAAIGPCIGACCYEVGSELVDAFASAGYARNVIDRWFLAPASGATFHRPTTRTGPQPLRLDVAAANRDQLMLAGVPERQVHVSGLCTAMHLDVLTSYRVEGAKAARIAGVIRVRPA